MPDSAKAIEVVRKFWACVSSREFDACEATMAEEIVRIGPRNADESDVSRGRRAYSDFIRSVITQLPSYHNMVHELLATPDGSRVYLRCTEWAAPESGSANEIEVPLILVCDVNDEHLITKVDIFWKTPNANLEWTKSEAIASS